MPNITALHSIISFFSYASAHLHKTTEHAGYKHFTPMQIMCRLVQISPANCCIYTPVYRQVKVQSFLLAL